MKSRKKIQLATTVTKEDECYRKQRLFEGLFDNSWQESSAPDCTEFKQNLKTYGISAANNGSGACALHQRGR